MSTEFEKWIQDTLPEPQEDALAARINLAILRDRMAGSAPRRALGPGRFLAVAVPAAAVLIFAGGVVELGSDDFALEESVLPGSDQPVLIKQFEDRGINVLPENTRADAEEIIQQRAANESVLRKVEGWMIDGDTHWALTRVYQVDGEEKMVFSDPVDPPTQLTAEIATFIMGEWDDLKSGVLSGALEPTGTQTIALDGVTCTVKVYRLISEDGGEVMYYLGGPTP